MYVEPSRIGRVWEGEDEEKRYLKQRKTMCRVSTMDHRASATEILEAQEG